jgi:hypothetical protein
MVEVDDRVGLEPGAAAAGYRPPSSAWVRLIVGDAVIGNPPGKCSLLPEKVMDDPVRLRHSMRALLDLEFKTLLVGDGVSILSSAKDRLRELTRQFPN